TFNLYYFADVHSITWNFLGSKGLSLPSYTERITVNDVTIFYYDSNMKSTPPCPNWLNTTAGHQLCSKTHFLSQHNMENMAEALQTVISQFNLTGTSSDINVYQGYSRCEQYPDGTMKSMLNHAFNGNDFLSLDIDNKRYIAAVSQALRYKNIRESHTILLETMVFFYKKTCFDHLKMFLEFAPGVNMTNGKTCVRAIAGSTFLTCHVTGFYPRAVQVKWIGADLQPMDDEMNDVLPNGDGTYQTRRSVIIPNENPGNHHYSCVVQHRSLKDNITVTW
ncbi:major histocompatibility complex class I UDA precursor, partial [Silurus meridionalis]